VGAVTRATPAHRWLLVATVLGSGMAYLDTTVVNVALPALSTDLDTDVRGLQWVLDAYLVSLTGLLLLGGALGDLYGRRAVFRIGAGGFAVSSVLCGLAPNTTTLVCARALQGVAGALLIPVSLALLSASVAEEDRARTVGAWAGLTGLASAAGPFIGGWLIDTASWRWAFFINVPVAAAALAASAHVDESFDHDASRHLDLPGAATAIIGLVALTAGLIVETPAVALLGVVLLGGFWQIERRSPNPMLPPSLFRSAQFTGANVTTFVVYAGLGVAFFLVVVQLQIGLGYSALEAGAALLPVTTAFLLLSPTMGALSQRIGPRAPMTVGPVVVAAGLLAFSNVRAGDTYLTGVLPATVIFGLGLSITVAPLTAAVLGSLEERHVGVGSAANYAVARLAGLLAIAVLPTVAGVELAAGPDGNLLGYETALRLSAVVCAIGGAVAAATIRNAREVHESLRPNMFHPCLEDAAVTARESPTRFDGPYPPTRHVSPGGTEPLDADSVRRDPELGEGLGGRGGEAC
jgi:EmrB/QacA subfamily drug resistance transporter